jgi:hypothetical protein
MSSSMSPIAKLSWLTTPTTSSLSFERDGSYASYRCVNSSTECGQGLIVSRPPGRQVATSRHEGPPEAPGGSARFAQIDLDEGIVVLGLLAAKRDHRRE